MKLSDFAKQMGTTRQTLYNKINAAGLDLAGLRDDSGELTNEGLSILSSLLDGYQSTRNASSKAIDAENPASTEVYSLREEIADLRTRLNAMTEERDELQKRVNSLLQDAADRERKHSDELHDILVRQQEIDAQRLLPARAGADGRGILSKLHDAIFGAKKQADPIKEQDQQ